MRTLLLLLYFTVCIGLYSQSDTTSVKIVLKSGSVYVGKVLLKNEEVIMLKDINGARFQFQISEINTITNETNQTTNTDSTTSGLEIPETVENFCSIIEAGILTTNARKAFDWQTASQFSISFGNKKTLGKNLFTGVGAGYIVGLSKDASAMPTLIPVFLKAILTAGKKKNTPHFGIESGYAFSASESFKGGLFTTLSAGISFGINSKTALYTSVFGAVYSLKANLTDITSTGSYRYFGTTSMNIAGLKVGLRF
jgi:hypothetical protein